jgi:hypothetical protein
MSSADEAVDICTKGSEISHPHLTQIIGTLNAEIVYNYSLRLYVELMQCTMWRERCLPSESVLKREAS